MSDPSRSSAFGPSKTDGFWDNKRITHKENILFVNDNTVENWVSAINDLFALNNDEYNLLIEKGIKLIKNFITN